MAEFGPQATQLSAPQGAGATPVQGVQTSSYTPNLAPVENLFKEGVKAYADIQKARAEEQKKTVLASYAQERQSSFDQWLQDQDHNKFMVRNAVTNNKFLTMAPELAGDFTKIAGLNSQDAGGIATDEASSERKRRQSVLQAASDAGIPTTGLGKQAQDSVIDMMQTSRRVQAQIKEMREGVEFESKQAGWERERTAAVRKEQVGQLLVQHSGKSAIAFNDALFDIASRISGGQLDPLEGQKQASAFMTRIQMELSSITVYDKEMAAPFKAQFDQIWNTYADYFKRGSDVTALKDQWEKLKLQSQMRVFGDPEFLDLSTTSQAFGNQPSLYQAIDPVVSKFLIRRGMLENGRTAPTKGKADPQIIGDTKFEGQAYGLVKGGIKGFLDGANKDADKKGLRNEVYGQMRGVMEQYVDKLQLGKLSPESRKNMNDFLLDKDVARFLKENPLPTDVARGLASAAEDNFKQFERTFNTAAGDMLKGIDLRNATQRMGGRGMGGQNQKPIRSDSVNPIDAVNISWQGDRLVFDPVSMPVDKLDQNRLTTQLNKVSEALSNGIKIAAHIQGEDNYGKYFDSVKYKMFPSKFEAPPQSNVREAPTGDYSKESNLKGISNSAPLVANGTPSDNVRQIREELKKQKDPAAIDALLQELEKELDKMR